MAEIDVEFEAIVTKGWKNSSSSSSSSSNKRSKKNEGGDDDDEEEEEEGIASVELILLSDKKKKLVLLGEPLDVFGSDIMLLILDNLDARDVALCLLVSRGWNEVASSDSLWNTRCEELWLGKAHIPRMLPGISRLAAYSFSVMDGKRTRIMKEDLCDHVWDFRFKKEVPEYWLNLDPSWNGTGPPMRRYFHADGYHSADPDDQVWGGHECNFKTITSSVGEGKIGERYVRINRWPHMTVARKHDWSWELTNRLYWYSSTPDADKEGGTGPLPQCGVQNTQFNMP